MNSAVLTVAKVHNVAQLVETLEYIQHILSVDPETILTFNGEGVPLRVRLIVDTLTDGSKVYNINIE